MLDTQTLLDGGMIYFDARLSRQHPTLEVRVADVCREPDDALLLAALTRALVETAVRQWQAGANPIRYALRCYDSRPGGRPVPGWTQSCSTRPAGGLRWPPTL